MRRFASLAILATTLLHDSLVQTVEPLAIDVHRDASCGCYKDWIKHLEANGFKATDHVEADISVVKSRLGVPYSMGSCHAGVIDSKFAEGHMLAADILKLHEHAGLAGTVVSGMPVGPPGMETGDRQDAYQAVDLTRSGQTSILAEYPGRQ